MRLTLAFVLGRSAAESDPFDPRGRALFVFKTSQEGAQEFYYVARELGLGRQAMEVIHGYGVPATPGEEVAA